jgi:N12 class adenine-specific DNA methylase
MSSYMTVYRREHPEYYEIEKKKDNERMKAKYANNPEHKEKVKQRALAYYYKKKEAKLNSIISVS